MKTTLAACFIFLVVCGLVDCNTNERPHILFILADDLGWNDIGYNNPYVFTPTLDALARDGVIFNQSYAQPACTPSRACLMSGYFAYHNGFQTEVMDKWTPNGLSLDFTILPQELKDLGYSTYMVGKWDLGYCKNEYTPNGRGFDHFYGFYTAGGDYYTHKNGKFLDLREDFTPDFDQDGVYSAELFAEKAANYVANHDKNEPMFMYLSLQSVHGPLQVPDKYLDRFNFVSNIGRRMKLGMTTAMDDTVAVVVEAFKEHGLWNNTLLIFLSDNGGPTNEGKDGNNWPLRGSKKTLWEGGTRVVNFVYGTMLEKTGYVNDGMIHIVDWFPTLVHVAGGESDQDMDGLNVWDTVSKGDPSPRTEFVYNIDVEEDPPYQAIRVGDYKLIHGKAGNPSDWVPPPEDDSLGGIENGRIYKAFTRLFNIIDDPTERNDLSEAMPDKLQKCWHGLKN
ncbi:arylsulfatase B-like [Ptychodera flava]|uniref:arylsulfatase B-like n=1 Tax=Ptychodera flava TaxID=63121 RepID=UPI003969C226